MGDRWAFGLLNPVPCMSKYTGTDGGRQSRRTG